MIFHINIACDNAAFDDGECNHELARILRDVADQIEEGIIGKARDIRDINGNTVGQFWLERSKR